MHQKTEPSVKRTVSGRGFRSGAFFFSREPSLREIIAKCGLTSDPPRNIAEIPPPPPNLPHQVPPLFPLALDERCKPAQFAIIFVAEKPRRDAFTMGAGSPAVSFPSCEVFGSGRGYERVVVGLGGSGVLLLV